MKFDQILFFLIILLSFIGPAIRKLFETKQPERKNRSREEVRKYLEKMRQLQQSEMHHQEDVVELEVVEEPARSLYVENNDFVHKQNKDFDNRFGDQNKFDRISDVVNEDVNQHVEKHMHSMSSSLDNHYKQETSVQKESKSDISKLQERVLENKNFNDLQRAFVLGEIFNKPKSLSDIS